MKLKVFNSVLLVITAFAFMSSCGNVDHHTASIAVVDPQVNSLEAVNPHNEKQIEGQIGIVDADGNFRAVSEDRIERYYRELLNKSGYQDFCKIEISKKESGSGGEHNYYLEMSIKDHSINVLSELKKAAKGKYVISGKTIACERSGCDEGSGCLPVVENGYLRCSNCDDECLNHSITTDEKQIRDFFLKES